MDNADYEQINQSSQLLISQLEEQRAIIVNGIFELNDYKDKITKEIKEQCTYFVDNIKTFTTLKQNIKEEQDKIKKEKERLSSEYLKINKMKLNIIHKEFKLKLYPNDVHYNINNPEIELSIPNSTQKILLSFEIESDLGVVYKFRTPDNKMMNVCDETTLFSTIDEIITQFKEQNINLYHHVKQLAKEKLKILPNKCVICLENDANIILLPCMHEIACQDCFPEYCQREIICAVCRKDITKYITKTDIIPI